ncbi:Mismatch repair endonuclease PMS2 [Colletotrichum sp. SAR 10_70]|nr:Mismatch repair endonuclease PMS2 [Colletotrichum sp. SAR 10_71]KAI8162531.1 Mismatch repair endonuclease PMS2 [Colletotrichum sp. SAR 10_70]KAI8201646.1 Mismatch repair endonuclease PMS2 [Colletotrichum sp. SAR 10_76]KAI8216376.1 Mismatch repair endonuclease PMS2 [Colletotrichum sp. SAR 10_77]KAI8222814.1 Mismatch repair endonuclease PMS2 [Colletotrichum sp. SAR 10_86]
MATIKPIEGRTVHQIQSGQVIVDLCSVVKELVENSIDAGASSVDVRFKNQGLDSIEVQDNGSGISHDDYDTIALKHYTSKLSTYADLATLETFGFRGEALSSLCALSRFSIVTCLAKDVPKGTRLEFEISGKLGNTSVIAAQKGTNVIVENLFYNLPVRRRELERNIKREWNKVISLLNQYACIQTGVKFTVSQQPSKGKRIVLFSTKGNPTTRENLVNIFGAKTMMVLVKLDMTLDFEPTVSRGVKNAQRIEKVSTEVRVQGYISRPAHGEGRQTPDRQMFFVNGRPCGLPQFAKVFNEVYKAYNSSQSPFIFADIQLDTHLYDVNVSPDKRTILLHDQNPNRSRDEAEKASDSLQDLDKIGAATDVGSQANGSDLPSSLRENHSSEAMETVNFIEELPRTPGELHSQIDAPSFKSPRLDDVSAPDQSVATEHQPEEDELERSEASSKRPTALNAGVKRKDATLQHEQSIKINEGGLHTQMRLWASEMKRENSRQTNALSALGLESQDAEEVLSLIITKADFGNMTIVGQFNMGFIIAVRYASGKGAGGSSSSDDELFIIDQHASDEKYNFERLQSTTVVQSQRLVHPKQLELTALEEEIVMENIAALNTNGFQVDVDRSGNQPVGSRCKLLALPLSHGTTFTLSDLEELISLLGDHQSNEGVSAPRPSKVRSMFAMRACRSSVMIGRALAHQQMEKLVRHMGELDKPWNCPHGRPTMRHLSGLGSWDEIGWKEDKPGVDWATYARG